MPKRAKMDAPAADKVSQAESSGCLRPALYAAGPLLIAVTLAALAALSASRAVSTGAPLASAPGFSACDLPCWAGVVPGQTAFDQAAAQVSAYLSPREVLFRTSGDRLAFEAGTGPEVSGALYDDRGLVGSIRLEVGFPLWALMKTLGAPGCVLASPLSGGQASLALFWDVGQGAQAAALAVLPAEAGAWHPGTPIRTLLLLSASGCRDHGALTWTGFAPLWRYTWR